MNLNTLTSGLITDKYGLRPALLCATRRDLAKHSVIRVLSKDGSGWVGISYGKVITGAKYQQGANTLNGVDALCKLLQLTDGHFDLIQMSSRLVGDELSQDIGVSIDQLLDELKLQQSDPLHEIVQRCKKNWESLYLLEGMTPGDDLPADGNSHATSMGGATSDADADAEYDDTDEWAVDETEESQWQVTRSDCEPEFDAHPAAQGQAAQIEEALLPDDLRLEPVDGVDILQKNDMAFSSPNLAMSLAQQAERVEASLQETDSTIYLSGPRDEQFGQNAPIYLSGPRSTDSTENSSNYLSGQTQVDGAPEPGSFGDPHKMLPAEIPKSNDRPPRLRITKEHQTPGRNELSSLREEMHFELTEFVQAKLSSSSRFFQQVDIQEMTDYQSSVVLRDLENALVQARKEETDPQVITQSVDRIPDRKRKMRKERIQVELEESRAELAALNAELDQAASGSFESLADGKAGLADKLADKIEVAKPKSRKTVGGTISELAQSGINFKPDEIPEASRELFAEQVQKKVEVDPKAFLSDQVAVKDEDLKLKILKQRQLRQSIILGSTTCLIAVSLMTLIGNLTKQATLGQASEKITKGDLKGARLEYEKIIKEQPSNWQAYMGHAISMPDDPQKRIEDYEKVLSLKSDEMLAAMGIAKAYLDLNQYDKANAAADKAASIDKANPEPHKLKAQSALKLGRYDAAITELKLALSRQPQKTDEIYYLLSTAYRDLKQPKNQVVYLSKAIEASPNNAIYLRERAILRFQSGDYKGTKADINASLSSNPGQGELHYILAKMLIKDGKSDKALDELTKAINLGYATADSFGQRGILYAAKRMYGEANVDLENATKANPNNRTYQRALARVDAAIEAVKARAGTRRLADASSDTISLKDIKGDPVQLGYELIRQGKYNSASTVLALAVRQNPNDPRPRSLLAHAFYLGGDYAKASTEFAHTYKLQGLSVDDHMLYGRSLVKAGRLEQAIDVLTNLVEQNPDFHKARIELIKAYSLSGFNDHAREQCQIGMRQAKTDAEYKQFKSLMP